MAEEVEKLETRGPKVPFFRCNFLLPYSPLYRMRGESSWFPFKPVAPGVVRIKSGPEVRATATLNFPLGGIRRIGTVTARVRGTARRLVFDTREPRELGIGKIEPLPENWEVKSVPVRFGSAGAMDLRPWSAEEAWVEVDFVEVSSR